MKRIECGDLVPGCSFKAQGASEAEVLSAEIAHAREVHNVAVTPPFLERARDRIQDVDDAPAGEVRRKAARRG